jgi:hypothetical protein
LTDQATLVAVSHGGQWLLTAVHLGPAGQDSLIGRMP